MKVLERNDLFLPNQYSLSCVENYFHFILDNEGCAYAHLYAECSLDFGSICNLILTQKVSYARFNGVQRLQDIGRTLGLVEVTCAEIQDVTSIIKMAEYCCLCVKPCFAKERYNMEFWREDHYILLTNYENGTFFFYNDNPREFGSVDIEQLEIYSANRVICFNGICEISNDVQKKLYQQFVEKLCIPESKYEGYTNENILAVRDVIGVLRVLRRRMYKYCSIYVECKFIEEYIAELDCLYLKLEYYRLRGIWKTSEIKEILMLLQQKDSIIRCRVKERMGL